jgi:AcrR family transcriptional regulator
MSGTSQSGKPLRRDAQRNRELLVAAAREVFAERGVDVALDEIARRAGVSIGTLYNRFPTRADLVEAVFVDRLEAVVALGEEALLMADPWEGFVHCLQGICELQAADRGYNDVASRGGPTSAASAEIGARGHELVKWVLARAQAAGVLRTDITFEDIAFVIWGHAGTVEATMAVAPRVWRRHLALMLDGFRASAAHPLPEPPLQPEQLQRAMRGDRS